MKGCFLKSLVSLSRITGVCLQFSLHDPDRQAHNPSAESLQYQAYLRIHPPPEVPRAKKKKKKKKARGSEASSSGGFAEESADSSPSSPAIIPSMSGPSERRPLCKFGAGCYRKNPDHKRQFSHPGDPDHPDTPAEEREAVPEEEGIAGTPATPARSASGIVAHESFADPDPGETTEDAGIKAVKWSSKFEGFGPSSGSGSKIKSFADLDEGVDDAEVVEALAVTPVARSATRTACRYGEACWDTRPDHRARFAHPGDPDHPSTVSAGASSSVARTSLRDHGLSTSGREDVMEGTYFDWNTMEMRKSDSKPENIDPESDLSPLRGAEARPIESPVPLAAEDPDEETEEDEEAAEIDFPVKARNRSGPSGKVCGLLLCCATLVPGIATFLAITLDNMVHLREDQQLVEPTWDGERVTNGPGTVISWPHARRDDFVVRKADRLSALHFAVVKHRRTQVVRHEIGPGLLFLRALEDLVEILPLKKLQLTQYHRLVDELTGDERIVRGPRAYAPEPLETIVQPDCWVRYEQFEGKGLAQDLQATSIENSKLKCSSMESCFAFSFCNRYGQLSCYYYSREPPDASSQESDTNSSDDSAEDDNDFADCWTYGRGACAETDPPQEAVMINAFQAMVVENKTSGLLRLVKTPGLFFPSAYEVLREWRYAILIEELSYAVVKDTLTGVTIVKPGPTLVMLEAYEILVKIGTKLVVKKDEFVRLVDRRTGAEEVVAGPAAVSHAPEEEVPDGVQSTALLDPLTSAILLDKTTGQQQLKVNTGILAPNAYQSILEVRPKVRVLDHQAAVTRAPDGQLTLHTSSFFLAPYHEIFSLPWSAYNSYVTEPAPKISVSVIDLRVQRLPWRFIALTSDNVRIQLTGTTFWSVSDALKMVTSTEDAPADVAQRSKAKLLSQVAQVQYKDFMASMTAIMDQTSLQQAADVFYTDRGLSVSRVEIVGYEATDDAVATALRSTVVEVATQVSRMIQAQTVIDVNSAKMNGEIRLAKLQTELIQSKAVNDLLLAISEGVKEGTRLVEEAIAFLDGLNTSINETESRVDLYRRYHEQDAVNELTRLFADGPASFYLHANETDLVLANFRSEL